MFDIRARIIGEKYICKGNFYKKIYYFYSSARTNSIGGIFAVLKVIFMIFATVIKCTISNSKICYENRKN